MIILLFMIILIFFGLILFDFIFIYIK